MWESDPSETSAIWAEGWTSVADDAYNSSATEEEGPQELPLWLVRLDQAAMLLFTFNTVILMLGMGATTYWKEFWEHLKQPWACLVGMACQFALLPAVGFGLCLAFQLPPYEALAVLILACSPGGAFSNFFTYWINGDLALSIIMTALSSLLAFGVMPLNVWLYSRGWTEQELQVPYVNILVSLVFMTLPVLAGMLVRHHSRKWASYMSKVCSLLGWAGAFTCGVLLVLRYWDIISKSSIFLVATAALLPCSGFLMAYIITKVFCFSHKICRTVAVEIECQNMVVAINIILLSFTDPQVRGRMVLFPVLYGLCQLAEVFVAIGLFQAWVFAHRHDVTEEATTSVVDTSVLTSIPVPAHKDSPARGVQVVEYAPTPDVCGGPVQPPSLMQTLGYSRRPHHEEWNGPAETQSLLTSPLNPQASNAQWNHSLPGLPPTPGLHASQDHHNANTHYPHWGSTDLYPSSDGVLESARSFDSDSPCSPTLSNRGVPNMFPVAESDFTTDFQSDFPSDFLSDFPSEREDSPPPYGSPIPSHRGRPLDPATVECQAAAEGGTSTSATPTSPRSPEPCPRPFAFYHRDVRLGQTQQFSTFGRR